MSEKERFERLLEEACKGHTKAVKEKKGCEVGVWLRRILWCEKQLAELGEW